MEAPRKRRCLDHQSQWASGASGEGGPEELFIQEILSDEELRPFTPRTSCVAHDFIFSFILFYFLNEAHANLVQVRCW